MTHCVWRVILAAILVAAAGKYVHLQSPPPTTLIIPDDFGDYYQLLHHGPVTTLISGKNTGVPYYLSEKNWSVNAWRGATLSQRERRSTRVHAATSTTTTLRLQDVALGKVIQVGSVKFVKVGENKYIATTPIPCVDPVLTYTGAAKDFDYTGGEQTFTAWPGCQYKLEVWGAQGGDGKKQSSDSENSTPGGYGAYSVGTALTGTTKVLYLNIGGKSTTHDGGYNGGGNSNNNNSPGGGGASSVAYLSGVLSSLSGHATNGNILIIAGGGGGTGRGIYDAEDTSVQGGNAGGYQGNGGATGTTYGSANTGCRSSYVVNPGAIGGSQTYGGNGATIRNGYNGTNGSFGVGGTGRNSTQGQYFGGAGGGGGYYGGGGGADSSGYCTNSGGGGGSGYIGSSNLVSAAGVTKHMTCYDCAESSDANTRTVSNNCVNSTATPDCSKQGNGYARITRMN